MSRPDAYAVIKGSPEYPDIRGTVYLYQTDKGTVVYASINGLPYSGSKCGDGVFGFHIHEGDMCSGDMKDPFAKAMSHYNPHECIHPYHAGDLPPLFGNKGYALMSFLTDRFTVNEVMGRTIIIHEKPDDFMTQPSGNSGNKIACGIIGRASLHPDVSCF
ncbi:MAG: superoxide dismutase family protein [Huintestinicola sp.]